MTPDDWMNAPLPDQSAPAATPTPGPAQDAGPSPDAWLSYDPSADQATQAAPPATGGLGWSDVPSALWSGIKRGVSDIGQTVEGGTSAPPPAAAAPYSWSDLWHPGSGASKFVYRMGESSPTLAGGIGAGLAGTAATGNPLVGIGAGALGAGGMAALQTIGPAFEHELKATPNDPDGAWDRALKQGALSGAFSGAAWAAFPLKFFNGPLKNAAFQILGVQPALSVAHQAASNVTEGQPPLQGAPEAYAEGAIGSAVPMAGHAVLGRLTGDQAARAAAAKAASGEPPTAAEMDDIADQHYADIRGMKITYTGAPELTKLRSNLRDLLYRTGNDERDQPGVFNAIDSLTRSRFPDEVDPITGDRTPVPPDWTDLDHARQRIAGYIRNPDPSVRRAATIALYGDHGKGGMLNWFADPDAQIRAGVPPSLAPELAQKMELARGFYRAARGMDAFDQIIEKANNSSNDRNVTLRNEIRKIVNNPSKQWQFPPEAIDLMRAGLHRGFWQAAAHASKLFDPHSSFGLFTNFMSHSMFGPEGLAAMPLAMGARYIGSRPLHRVEENVPRMIGARPTGGRWQPPTLMERSAAGYTPFVGPVAPQQPGYADGGDVDQGDAPDVAMNAAPPDAPPSDNDQTPFSPPSYDQQWVQDHPTFMSRIEGAPQKLFHDFVQQPVEDFHDLYQTFSQDPNADITPDIAGKGLGVAGAAMTGATPFAMARGVDPNSVGMFFRPAAAERMGAEKLQTAGWTPDDIWRGTKMFQDANGDWRKEILGPTKLNVSDQDLAANAGDTHRLQDLLNAPHLWGPAGKVISDLPVETHPFNPQASADTLGLYQPYTRQNGFPGDPRMAVDPYIWMRPPGTIPGVSWSPRDTLYHETQHAIDQRAGLLRRIGGDPDWFNKRDPNDPIWQVYMNELKKPGATPQSARQVADFQRYKRSIHEVMARNAARRSDLFNYLYETSGSLEQPLIWQNEYPPIRTEDVPRFQQLMGPVTGQRRGGAVKRALQVAKYRDNSYIT